MPIDDKREVNRELEHLSEVDNSVEDNEEEPVAQPSSPDTEQPDDLSHRRYPRWQAWLAILVRIIVGATFIFSGVVKLIDPAGTAYKIEDYLAILNLSQFASFAYMASMLLSLTELILGVNALLGLYLRTTPWLLLVFMGVMTPLTLFLAIANPIPDCGCFGDAIKLTNWQTFGKNMVLLASVVLLVRYNKAARSVFHREVHALVVTWCIIFGIVITSFAINRMPLLDFRPFKVGVDLRAAYYGDDLQGIEYDFVYEKEGVEQTFTIDNLPAADEGWTFVSRTARTAPQAQVANELDYFIVYDGDEDVTEEVLDADGYTFMILSPDVTTAKDQYISKVHELYDYCLEYGYPFYAVTSSSPAEIAVWMDNTGGEYSFLFMDKTTIRTIARNNPFVLVLKDGVIYHKYPISRLPDESLLTRPFDEIEGYGTPATYNVNKRVAFIVTLLVVPLVVLMFTERIALFLLRKLRNKYNVWKEKRAQKKGAVEPVKDNEQ